MKESEREIAEHEAFLAGHATDDDIRAARIEQLASAKKKRAEILIGEARERVSEIPPICISVLN